MKGKRKEKSSKMLVIEAVAAIIALSYLVFLQQKVFVFSRIVCIGDSITAGNKLNDAQPTYCEKLGGALGKPSFIFAFSGADSKSMAEWSGYFRIRPQSLVLIMLGTNDAGKRASGSEFKSNMKHIIENTNNENLLILLVPPDVDFSNSNVSAYYSRTEYSNIQQDVRDLGKDNSLMVVDLSKTLDEINGTRLGDGVHPTAFGQYIILLNFLHQVKNSPISEVILNETKGSLPPIPTG